MFTHLERESLRKFEILAFHLDFSLGQISRVRTKESDFLITLFFNMTFTWDSISLRSANGVRY
jgi:hypothetical protein